jgi:hypothetical protein
MQVNCGCFDETILYVILEGFVLIGARTYSWNVNTTGMSQSRVVAINRFNELGGFFIFRDLYLSTDFKWPGADIMLPMIQAIIEVIVFQPCFVIPFSFVSNTLDGDIS